MNGDSLHQDHLNGAGKKASGKKSPIKKSNCETEIESPDSESPLWFRRLLTFLKLCEPRSLLYRLTDSITRNRSIKRIRQVQISLFVVTVIVFAGVLSYPAFLQPDIDLSSGGPWAVGKNAPATLTARSDIDFPRLAQYEMLKKESEQTSPLFFIRDYAMLQESVAPTAATSKDKNFRSTLDEDLKQLDTCKLQPLLLDQMNYCVRQRVFRWRKIKTDGLDSLILMKNSDVRNIIIQAVNIVYQKYLILDKSEFDANFQGTVVRVKDINAGAESQISSLPIEMIITKDQLFTHEMSTKISNLLEERMPQLPARTRNALVDLSRIYLYPLHSVTFSSEETERIRLDAVSKVSIPFYHVSRGDTIVQKDEMITDEKFTALRLHKKERSLDRIRRVIVVTIQQTLLLMLMTYFAYHFHLKLRNDLSATLILFVILMMFASVLLAVETQWTNNIEANESIHYFASWVPVGFFVILLSLLLGESVTLPVGIYFAIIIFIASKYEGNSLFFAAGQAILAAILGSKIKRRSHFITSAFLLACIAVGMITATYLYTNRPITGGVIGSSIFSSGYVDAIRSAFYASFASILVIAILPVFEAIFNTPTRFKLVELQDPSHPLLQQLFQHAPATWNHTMMVATMVEKACERLGLNSMLARTGVYYHDIGKMKNPLYFIENQQLNPGQVKFETLNDMHPIMAARIIIEHVLDGVTMARKARLPREVIDFIPEHHGTSTMTFFYHRALKKGRGRLKINRDDFRYPGPMPQTKESGIVMLADSIEAASRSIVNINENSLDTMAQKIFQTKISEHQLDQCGLTIGDLNTIKQAFIDVLVSTHHIRPKYPNANEVGKLEAEKKEMKNKQAKRSSAI